MQAYKKVVVPMSKTDTTAVEKDTSHSCVGDLTYIPGKNATQETAQGSLMPTQRETVHQAQIADQAAETADTLSTTHTNKDLPAGTEDILHPITNATTKTVYTLIHLSTINT